MYINGENVSNHFTQVNKQQDCGPTQILDPSCTHEYKQIQDVKMFLLTVFPFYLDICERDKNERQKGDENQRQLRTWQHYDAKSTRFLPCQEDPRCTRTGVGRWGPAAEFASLWTGRRGLCACLRWPAPGTYLWLPKHTHKNTSVSSHRSRSSYTTASNITAISII